MALRVLITNPWLSSRSGSELYVSDLARALLARGHRPVAYAPTLGPLALELREATIPVVDDLALVTAVPDLIHGHHNHQIMTALLHFPGVPAVRFCHGWHDERPEPFPRILRFVAVDETVRDRLVSEWGIPEARVQVHLNFVDLTRFRARGPLPARPAKALVFSNAAATHLPAVRRACETLGIAVEAVGASVGQIAHAPEALLGGYDVVFAKARCALEAMAAGPAVVLCDAAGLGPLVTPANFDELRAQNFGIRALRASPTPEAIARELAKYDPSGAAEVTRRVRATAGLETAVDGILEIYQEVLSEWRSAPRPAEADELRAAAAYLRRLEPMHGLTRNLRRHAYDFLREIYVRCEHVAGLRWLLPRRALAKRLSAAMRGH